MLGKKRINKLITTFAALCVCATAALAAPNSDGEITVTGQVSVNGQPAVSSSTVVSGSTVTSGANSSAIINLGSKGKVELAADTSLSLKFTDNSIVAMLSAGKVRVMNAAGIGATVTTRSGTVVADTGQANSFTVDIGCGDDAKCSQTFVETASGLVTLRSANTVKQVAAGTDASSGNPSQTGCKPCMRPGSAPPTPVAGIGNGAIVAIIVAAAAAAGAAMFLGRDNEVNQSGGVTIISPVR